MTRDKAALARIVALPVPPNDGRLMPRTRDLARLFRAVAQGDLSRARALAVEITDHEEQAGIQ